MKTTSANGARRANSDLDMNRTRESLQKAGLIYVERREDI
jgi:hypothetical protein